MLRKIKRNKPLFTIKRGSIQVPGYERHQVKNGIVYTSYSIPDYIDGKRKLRTFADLAEAKTKATEIAEAIQQGQPELQRWQDGLRIEIRRSLETIVPTGLNLLPACTLLNQAVAILDGKTDKLLAACQFFVTHGAESVPFTAKNTKTAAAEFLATKKPSISIRRFNALESYLNRFADTFKGKSLHEVTAVEVQDFANKSPHWAPKTHNEFLGCVALLYKEAQFRNWVDKKCNPAQTIKRKKVIQGPVEIFTPEEAATILRNIDTELIPALVLWHFSGLRKEEASRVTWSQVNEGLQSGWIHIEASQTKTGRERSIPVLPNAKAWLEKFKQDSGSVLPSRWQGRRKLDELPSYVSRKTGVVWRANAPRHSFGSYYFKLCKDSGKVVMAMGNSITEFERHYWCKSRTLTDDVAKAYFDIFP